MTRLVRSLAKSRTLRKLEVHEFFINDRVTFWDATSTQRIVATAINPPPCFSYTAFSSPSPHSLWRVYSTLSFSLCLYMTVLSFAVSLVTSVSKIVLFPFIPISTETTEKGKRFKHKARIQLYSQARKSLGAFELHGMGGKGLGWVVRSFSRRRRRDCLVRGRPSGRIKERGAKPLNEMG